MPDLHSLSEETSPVGAHRDAAPGSHDGPTGRESAPAALSPDARREHHRAEVGRGSDCQKDVCSPPPPRHTMLELLSRSF